MFRSYYSAVQVGWIGSFESARPFFIQFQADLLTLLREIGVVGSGVSDNPAIEIVFRAYASSGFVVAVTDYYYAGTIDFRDTA